MTFKDVEPFLRGTKSDGCGTQVGVQICGYVTLCTYPSLQAAWDTRSRVLLIPVLCDVKDVEPFLRGTKSDGCGTQVGVQICGYVTLCTYKVVFCRTFFFLVSPVDW